MGLSIQSLKFYFTFLILVLSACSPSNEVLNQEPSTEGVTEFTPVHPDTGLPLKLKDFNSDLFKETLYVEEDPSVEDENSLLKLLSYTPMEISYPEVNIQKEKEIFLFGWTSEGAYNASLSNSCHFSEVEKIVKRNVAYNSQRADSLQEWANKCEKELSRGRTSSVATILRFDNVKFDITKKEPRVIEFYFEDHVRLRGVLFLKDNKKRPTVIFKGGLYADAADSGVMRNFVMHLVEESPFHVVYLANVTGREFSRLNGNLFLGGFDEGRQIVRVAEEIMARPDLASYVEDFHAMGVSLGSHGVLFSSLYSSYLPESNSKIKSAFAFCPVVNLEPTMASLFDKSVRATFYNILTVNFLRNVFNDVPILGQLLNPDGDWSRREIFEALKSGAILNYIRRTTKTPWDLEPFYGHRIESEADYWNVNNFIEHAHNVTTPTMIVHADNDFLVRSDFNSEELFNKLRGRNSAIGVVKFQNGSHCGFNVAQGWPTISSLVREYVLKHSSYVDETQNVEIVLPSSGYPVLRGRNQITKTTWTYDKYKSKVALELEYYDADEYRGTTRCSRYKPTLAPEFCYKNVSRLLDAQIFMAANLPKPTNEDEVTQMLRWLNTRGILYNSGNEMALGTKSWPVKFVVKMKD